MRKYNMVSYEEAREKYCYNPESGHILWVHPTPTRIKNGMVAGYKNTLGYIEVKIKGVKLMAHRIAWLLTYKKLPDEFIDHINGDRTDNRLCNLRECTNRENQRNRHTHRDGKIVGIRKRQKSSTWDVRIGLDNIVLEYGTYRDMEVAYNVYLEASARLVNGEDMYIVQKEYMEYARKLKRDSLEERPEGV